MHQAVFLATSHAAVNVAGPKLQHLYCLSRAKSCGIGIETLPPFCKLQNPSGVVSALAVMVLQSLTSRAVESALASTASPAVAGAGAQGMYQDYR
jgi:hypothetical protein